MNTSCRMTKSGHSMPFLMACTSAEPIYEETASPYTLYNPHSQTSVIDARVVGTRSLKVSTTVKRTIHGPRCSSQDKKNEIDDQKNV